MSLVSNESASKVCLRASAVARETPLFGKVGIISASVSRAMLLSSCPSHHSDSQRLEFLAFLAADHFLGLLSAGDFLGLRLDLAKLIRPNDLTLNPI